MPFLLSLVLHSLSADPKINVASQEKQVIYHSITTINPLNLVALYMMPIQEGKYGFDSHLEDSELFNLGTLLHLTLPHKCCKC